jgi:hypothetical protein
MVDMKLQALKTCKQHLKQSLANWPHAKDDATAERKRKPRGGRERGTRLFSLSDSHRRWLLLEERLQELWFNRPVVVQDRLLGGRLGTHPFGARFLSCEERRSQRAAEIIILPAISVRPNLFVFARCLSSSFVPFKHDAIPDDA